MTDKIIHSIATAAAELGILNETAYRNLCIRKEFEKLRREGKDMGTTVEEVVLTLADKYSLSYELVMKIVYERSKK